MAVATAPLDLTTTTPDPVVPTAVAAPVAAAAPAAAASATEAPTTDENDESYLRAVAKGFVIGTVIWAALIFVIMYVIADIPLDMSAKWALWIGPWGGLFLGGTFTVGFWSAKHAED